MSNLKLWETIQLSKQQKKAFEIIDSYYKHGRGIRCCQGCFYEHTASCAYCDDRIPLCLEQLKKHTGIDYTNEIREG